jgi:hypothetical protein
MIFLFLYILVLPVNLAVAWWHKRLIKDDRPIVHGLWAALYAVLIAVAAWLLPGMSIGKIAAFALAASCGRLAIFAPALNLMRGLSLTYISKTSTSIIDKMEVRLFGTRAWLVEIIAGVIFFILQFFL